MTIHTRPITPSQSTNPIPRAFRFPPAHKGLKALCLLLMAVLVCRIATAADEALWEEFKSRFITPEGRVVDTGNHGASHSEGQGYAMLLAHAHGDRETFESVWNWSRQNLQVRTDPLLAWSWKPSSSGGSVADINNATDGDLLVAWALLRAADRWSNPKWKVAASRILKEVRTNLLRVSPLGPLLLPGKVGFEKPQGVIINLSYYLFPAFKEFERLDPDPEWQKLSESGLALIRRARFSSAQLPPDWLLVHGTTVRPSPTFPREYGYNAVRIPLHLVWGGVPEMSYFEPFRRLSSAKYIPATYDLASGSPGKERALPGMEAIYRLIAWSGDLDKVKHQPIYREMGESEPYFSASLGLLTNLAAQEVETPTQP